MLHQWLLGPLRIAVNILYENRYRGDYTSWAASGTAAVSGVGLQPHLAPAVPSIG